MLEPLQQNEQFYEETHTTPLKHAVSTLPAKSQTFYTMNIFSESPEGFALLLGQCTALLR